MAVAALSLLAAGCGGAVRVDPPTPRGTAATACAALTDRLPRTLDGAERVPSDPPSPYVAVWGEGEIALRCGVPRPAALDPTQQVPEINGVPWFADPARPSLFTALIRDGYVEVTISPRHQAASVLLDLAAPIKAAFSA
ncbi:hypothetical protein Sme01_28130 [Sphaerisporangium melleum]|uniref:DUF3515 domain-containing protein n=2 Tax=Sphaerisporangium melleum TaxID=321316 RepID=A0A917QVQ6_9ACTN|nr:hypothetical protein GCM10007964_11220 [Sphaerisporangium melleum]GII70337.1 hypothetical protein Sme01_28130 [Sphaerisporangium melleum]